ncbi:DUF1992 domain-containing protein [Glutamicibacter uratoxydans]|uniref:DnaJ family domain-containing protein n=1 Tax=Glutamicibacter uratoxydans TaxID=43667 RepID=UPI003D6FA149
MNSESKYPERDAALNAARYRMERSAEDPLPVDEYAEKTGRNLGNEKPRTPLQMYAEDEAWEVANSALDDAFARGEFDNLALAGQKIDHLTGTNDPDWWVKGMMRREQISGLGPPALLLRVEDQHLDETLDRFGDQQQVREHLQDFNQRVIEARRQLQGGPPVVTDLRDVDHEVAQWQLRRQRQPAEDQTNASAAPAPKRRWWRRARD